MSDDKRQQRMEEGRVQKGGNNGVPINPPQNLRPITPPPSTGNTSSSSSTSSNSNSGTPSSSSASTDNQQ